MAIEDQLKQAFETLTDRLRDEVAREIRSMSDGLIASAAEERSQAAARLSSAVAAAQSAEPVGAPVQRLVEAIRAIDAGHSLGEILDALLTHASRETARAAVLLVRGERLRIWKSSGFATAIAPSHELDIPMEQSGLVAESILSGDVAFSESSQSAPRMAHLQDGCACFAAPIVMGGQVVAVLYADNGPAPAADAERRTSRGWPDALEMMTRHAARCLESLTAFSAARALTGQSAPVSQDPPWSGASGSASDEDEAARRYARLLVSEIKLYHEAAVAAGQRERDVATRLSGEIARARGLYEERVSASLRSRTDYFNEEIVRTLAAGDARLLGV